MKMLGLDLGEKNIGVAVSDATGLLARGIGTIEHTDFADDAARVLKLARQHKAEAIVVGLPLNMNGTEGKKAREAKMFAESLRESADLPVELHDERLSTVYSERMLISAGVSRAKRKKVVDRLAAQVILQSYLDLARGRKEGV